MKSRVIRVCIVIAAAAFAASSCSGTSRLKVDASQSGKVVAGSQSARDFAPLAVDN